MDHDAIFKQLIRTFFFDFIELFFPDAARYMDRRRVEFLDKEVFTDVAGGAKHEADLVVRVRFRGKPAFFLVHVEAQSKPQADFPARMFSYFARLTETYRLPVYPIVIWTHAKPTRPEANTYRVAFDDLEVLRFAYRTVQLNRLDWRDFARRENRVATALMARMRIAPEDRVRAKFECFRLIATLRYNPAEQRVIGQFVDRYLLLGADEQRHLMQKVADVSRPRERKVMHNLMGNFERIGHKKGLREGLGKGLREGLGRGLREGHGKGLREGRVDVLCTLLLRKCGALPGPVKKQIAALSDARLSALAEALLDFESLSELKAWLARK